MKPRYLLTILALLFHSTLAGSIAHSQLTAMNADLKPLSFTQNDGQWNEQALFRTSAGGFTAWFTKDKVVYQFTRSIPSPPTPLPQGEGRSRKWDDAECHSREGGNPEFAEHWARFADDKDSTATMSISATFVGANPHPQVIGDGLMDYRCNYLIGNDPTKWHTDVPNYKAVVYKGIYPGIDLQYYGNGDGKIEYDFIIQPGANPSQIAIRYDGADNICVDGLGQLVVETGWGKMIERAPRVWQVAEGDPVEIAGEYSLRGDDMFGFSLEDYRPEYAVVVDPVLSFSTYAGGSEQDFGNGIAVDNSGAIYVGGDTYSIDFPTEIAYQEELSGRSDIVVMKLSHNGDSLIFSTYIGGGLDDFAGDIAIDKLGRIYVTGQTRSADFPVASAAQQNLAGYANAFVTCLSASGNSLSYSTYLGGNYVDYGQGIAVDTAGCAYVTGWTRSSNFPRVNAIYGTYSGDDGFVTKLSSIGGNLVFSTLLGGPNWTEGYNIALDKDRNVYIIGTTACVSLPVVNAVQAIYQGGNSDAFLMEINSAGSAVLFSSFLGGAGSDRGYGIVLDDSGMVYVTGGTASTNFPVSSAVQTNYGGSVWDAFATKVNVATHGIAYSTYLGGNELDMARRIAVDDQGCAYLCGWTTSSDFPVVNAYMDSLQAEYHSDAFVSKLSHDGNALVFSTYFGGSEDDAAKSIALDGKGHLFIAGESASTDLPTRNAVQDVNHDHYDAFVTRLRESKCGDVDGSHDIDIADAVYLVNYIFSSGPAPNPLAVGDADCGGDIDVADAAYLINYIFSGGPEPCEGC